MRSAATRAFRGLFRSFRMRSPRPVILMYHRVADPVLDPWGLAVRPDHFEAHLAVLRRTRQPLSMSEFVHRLDAGTLPRRAVAVTFDDGYADNLRHARPRLAAAGVPATLFLTTGAVGAPTGYWWDELARGILCNPDAVDCVAVLAGERFRMQFPPVGHEADRHLTWRAWEPPASERQVAYVAIWRRLRDMPGAERDGAMAQLRERLAPPPPEPDDLPMTAREIAALAESGIFEIGAHTASHPALPALDAAERRREILEGKRACERLAGSSVRGFSYPHGAADPDTVAAVQECGFTWACATGDRAVRPAAVDRFTLPRLSVPDVDGPRFEALLRSVPV